MAKAISGHSAPKSGIAMAIVAIPVALPLRLWRLILAPTSAPPWRLRRSVSPLPAALASDHSQYSQPFLKRTRLAGCHLIFVYQDENFSYLLTSPNHVFVTLTHDDTSFLSNSLRHNV